jgi:hypothetical protein
LPIHWKVLAGLVAGICAGVLVVAFFPRIQPSATTAKAAVEQPVFIAQPAIATQRAPAAGHPLAKDLVNKLATALRGPTTDPTPIASLTIPIDDARRLCAEGLVAFAKGDIASALLQRSAEGGDARALMVLGDTYDPTTLRRLGVIGLKGDEVTARNYYSRALAAGVGGARARIAALASK